MKWIIEYVNGIIISENNNEFFIDNLNKVKKVYFTDNKNQYGFNRDGKFFINKYIFDFKINIDNFNMIPFQSKTGQFLFSPYDKASGINSWNIGYRLINDEEEYIYTLIIKNDKTIHFEAKHYKLNELVKENKIRLQ